MANDRLPAIVFAGAPFTVATYCIGTGKDLAAKVLHLNSHPPVRVQMRAAARKEFEDRYTADVNYRLLRRIYDRAVAGHAVM